ncbi:MAG: hypothetical protein EP330_28010 [Deltaproteobacteria bacterium]|nr:MAG: hypothetical protein EP330_28010 [Deltaproteobacteria bacterium]
MSADLEVLSAYLAGELSTEATAELEARLAAEPLLAEELSAMQQLNDHLADLDEMPPPPELNEAVLAAAATTAATSATVGLGTWLLGGLVLAGLGAAAYLARPAVAPMPAPESSAVQAPPVAPPVSRVREVLARGITLPADGSCESLEAYVPPAMEGRLDAGSTACIEAVRLGDDAELAGMASMLLLQDAWVREDKDTWRALAVDHVSAIDPLDANLWTKLALDAHRQGDHSFAVATAVDGLEVADTWPDEVRDHHTTTLHVVRVNALIALDAAPDELLPAIEGWHGHVAATGGDTSRVDVLCAAHGADCAP